MKSEHHSRKHDLHGRKILTNVCNYGSGLDIGSSDRPLSENCITVDSDRSTNPDICCDATNIPVEDNSQDFVVSSHSLEHMDNPIDVLTEWYRVLKVSGRIGILLPHGEFVSSKDLGDSDHTHRMLFTEKTLEIYLEYVGFKNVNVRRLRRPLAYNKAPAIIAFGIK